MLPEPYERWFAEMCSRPSPVEKRSTCEACAMLPGAPDLPPEGPFDPELRCCTYHPHLAPHFVGAILDGGGAGRARVLERLAARAGVTPLGLAPSPAFTAVYQREAARAGAFGRSRAIRCPFLDGTRCTIWPHRGPACAAFHCKLDRGALGQQLWTLILFAFTAVERELGRWLLGKKGLDAAACDALLRAPEDAALDARAWGDWRGREEEYFIEAARLVGALSWAEVAALGGEIGGLGDAMRGALARFDALGPPERVRRNPQVLYQLGKDGRARLQSPGVPHDLLEVPAAVAQLLLRIEEAPLGELGLDGPLARRLLDWQVLLDASL
jgi:hypothetical protein